jgi:hypothetical protein
MQMLFRKLKLDWAYGISELVIVVVGVLIALAADGLRERAAERSLEADYVQRLIEDLKRDTAALSELIEQTESRSRSAQVVVDTYDRGSFVGEPTDFARSVEFAMWFAYPDYSRETIDYLMSTGNLRLVQSPELKSAVASTP